MSNTVYTRPENGEAGVEFNMGGVYRDKEAREKTRATVLTAAQTLRGAIAKAGLDYAKGWKGNKIAICKLSMLSITNAADVVPELLLKHKSEID